MTIYLRGAAFDVQVARNGEEGPFRARAPAERDRPRHHAPALDGWEVLSLLKADPRTAGIPVVIVSMLDERGRGFALGAADYLVKPVTRDHVAAALSRCATTAPKPCWR